MYFISRNLNLSSHMEMAVGYHLDSAPHPWNGSSELQFLNSSLCQVDGGNVTLVP